MKTITPKTLSFLSFAFFLVVTPRAFAATYVYVSLAPEQRINVYRLNTSTGELAAVDSLPVEGAPGCLSADPKQQFLFASLRSKSALASYRIDAASGKLALVSTAELPAGENAAYVATDASGRFLFSASYSAGKVFVHEIGKDGKISATPLDASETAKTAHCVTIGPSNKFVFVPHVAPNAIYQFRLDSTTGKLIDAGRAPGGAENAGPRHLAFHPTLRMAFSSDESGSSITAYAYDAESGLKPVQTLSTLPPDFKERNSTAEVKVHPSGKFVWVSNRGHDSLAGFAINAEGKLSAVGRYPTEKTPRSFDIEPAGRYVFGAGEGSGKLAVFEVVLDTGELKRTHTYEVGRSLTWVRALALD